MKYKDKMNNVAVYLDASMIEKIDNERGHAIPRSTWIANLIENHFNEPPRGSDGKMLTALIHILVEKGLISRTELVNKVARKRRAP